MSVLVEQQVLKGGAFLTNECAVENTFTPEDFTEEHRMIANTTRSFVDNEVTPRLAQLEQHDWRLARDLVRNAAELGLIGANIPAAYGGLGLNHTTGALIAENTGRCTSFAATCGIQTGVGLWPITHFGTDTARQNYLPRIASGELITAYALTEATAGSDALAARTTARLSEDGTHYILNGEKLFVTNGGLADIFAVFAKVDGDKLSAFIVEAQEGVTPGLEERKMGVRGSSTTSLVLTDARVPRENLLGEAGMGDKIAFGILNLGRCKLGAICVGAMKLMLEQATRYARERKQFGRSISSFGAIRAKLAEMTIRTWVAESMVYRTLGLIEGGIGAIGSSDANDSRAWLRVMEEYAAECSIVKVAVSEYCNYVADEMVQTYGGYGYLADYPAESAFRDSRLTRLGEGTNEINRLLIASRLMKSATGECSPFATDAQPLHEQSLLRRAKQAALTALRMATQMNKLSLSEQQAIMMGIADIIIDTYAMESAILRTQKAAAPSSYVDMTQVFCTDAMQRIEVTLKNIISATDGRGPLAVRQRIARAVQF